MSQKQERILMIVESPNKIKTLKSFLPSNYIVMASVGHITQIADKQDSYHNSGVYPNEEFKTNYVISKDKKEVVDKLKEQVEIADKIYLASDPDREGEAISWSLNKFLKIPKNKCYRITFHEITKNAVLKAIENPRKIDDNLVEAAQARQQLDKLEGYRLSPIARRTVGAKSVGRCQSAGLKLIVDREKEIQKFNSETFYELNLNFEKNNQLFKAKYKSKDKINDKSKIEVIKDYCNKNPKYIITNIENKDKITNPKPPFTTSTFQQEVSQKLGIEVETAQSYAQKLFEGINVGNEHIAIITYIRTDCAEFSPEFLPLLEKYVKDTYGEKYYSPIKKAKKSENAQEGHEAIRPVDLSMTPSKLSQYINDNRLLKVYEIIYNRTIATMMSPSIISETIYSLSNDKYIFEMKSSELKFDGFKKVYNYKEDDDEELVKITFNLNEEINKSNNPLLTIEEKQTKPPSRFKEATFIKELEKSGIGRPSTFATILKTIKDPSRGYCEILDKYLVPTEKGIQLSNFLDSSFPDLINISYTNEMEKDLDLIANGKLKKNDFLHSFLDKMENSVKNVKTTYTSTPKEHIEADFVCPNCGAKMYLRKGSYGEFWGCSKYPKCKTIIKKEK